MQDLTGRTIGGYELLDKIGRGGMADVYRGIQRSINREVAIKVLPAHLVQDPTFLGRFNHEVQIIAHLESPRVLPIYDYGDDEGLPFIVMRLIDGGSLADRIRSRPGGIDLPSVLRYVDQIAEGLDFAHRQNIIHRDFKPSNVLLDRENNLYLADFGIAKAVESTAQFTGSGIVGTPAYMAPELFNKEDLTGAVDVYALGITLYQMITGKLPYEMDTPMQFMMAHVNNPVPNILAEQPNLPHAIQPVLHTALAKSPRDRYQTAGQLAQNLRAAIEGQPLDRQTLIETMPDTRPLENTLIENPSYSVGTTPVTPPVARPIAQPVAPPAAPPPTPDSRDRGRRRGGSSLIGVGIAAIGLAVLAGVVVVGAIFLLPMLTGSSPTQSAVGPVPEVVADQPDAPAEAIAPTDAPASTSQSFQAPTDIPAPTDPPPTDPPTATPPRNFFNLRFCDLQCTQGGVEQRSIPGGATYFWIAFDYADMASGTPYSRIWRVDGRQWLRYDCEWGGPRSGTFEVPVRDAQQPITSGEWEITLLIEDQVALQDSIDVLGSVTRWTPLNETGSYPCPDWQ